MKRIITIMLAATILVGTLAGCAAQTDGTGAQETETQAGSEAVKETETQADSEAVKETETQASGEELQETKRTIVDMSGNEISLPDSVNKYAVAWAGLTDILFMFDGIDHLVAYPEKSASFKWIFDVYPELSDRVCLSNEGISAEEIMETGAEVVFLKAADDEDLYNKLNAVGIAAVDCKFDTYDDLVKVVKMIAEALGTEEASAKAVEYEKYITDSAAYAQRVTEQLTEDEKISLLILRDTKNYTAYGATRYTGEWSILCGAKYAMVNEDMYANVNLTKEQLLEYDPDFILFAMPNQAKAFLEDNTWSSMKAVQNGHVVNVPGGFNTWSNCGAESALIYKWAINLFYPEKAEYDINEETKLFYEKFYGVTISDEQASAILGGDNS